MLVQAVLEALLLYSVDYVLLMLVLVADRAPVPHSCWVVAGTVFLDGG